ncbi:ABC efflux pump, inner membrane subunit [Candidatus Koribacter versatilis Ellin345]|uniref:ABC efflux pump, inner membrane subunit n=2 Tax=Candidatus Korobacter versatilis TaxID=658062 RepID=Q1IU86_KORVE|nr:ABC efflux pump, inner membrane subunit [Candidatus Koribacter versatilis Ellin345]
MRDWGRVPYNREDMMNRMIVSNLVHRPLRSVISIVAIAIEVTLILLIVGLSVGMLNDSRKRTAGIGADVMVQPPNASALSTFSTASVPIKVAGALEKLPHVIAAVPVVMSTNTSGSIEVIYGIDLTAGSPYNFDNTGRPFRYIAGGPFQGPNDMLVDDYFASDKHVKVGDQLELFNHKFRVSGIVENGKGARKFLPISTLQNLMGVEGKASMFYLRLDNPANADLVVQEIKNTPGLETYTARSLQAFLSMMTVEKLPGFSNFIKVVVGIAMIIGFIVIFQSMYTAVMERTREIGILKSLGANKVYIVRLILRETLTLAVCGIALGIGFSYAARLGIRAKFPLMTVQMTAPWIGYATLIAVVGAMMGAIYPAVKAAQKDPIDALAYE